MIIGKGNPKILPRFSLLKKNKPARNSLNRNDNRFIYNLTKNRTVFTYTICAIRNKLFAILYAHVWKLLLCACIVACILSPGSIMVYKCLESVWCANIVYQ